VQTALLLLDHGAKPDTSTSRASPFPVPLVMSAARGDVELCSRLIQAGSDPDELHPTEGFAPLHAAVSSEASRTEVIRLLLASGADVNLLRSANPIWSPLMYAATRGSLEHLQLLLGE
jgi:ankyrin repeat protein